MEQKVEVYKETIRRMVDNVRAGEILIGPDKELIVVLYDDDDIYRIASITHGVMLPWEFKADEKEKLIEKLNATGYQKPVNVRIHCTLEVG